MTEETVVQPQTAEPTLEDVYKSAGADANVQPEVQQVVQPPASVVQPAVQAAPSIPDPYDTEAFKAYLAQQANSTAATQDVVRRVAGFLTQQQVKEAKAALENDLKSAVSTVNEVVGHPKPKVIEAMLDAKAREDTRFKALWENRSRNPAAWNNALKAVAKEFQEDLSVKVDPQLAAAQRARKVAQSAMATTNSPQSETEEWESLSADEQDAKYQRILNGGAG